MSRDAASDLWIADKEEGDPEGPLWYTFTFRLPFGLGLSYTGSEEHVISFQPPDDGASPWRESKQDEAFGPQPLVRLKFFAKELEGLVVVPDDVDEVLEALYGQRLLPAHGHWPVMGEKGEVYEQWVSVETQGARARDEDPNDRAYAFHRCLRGLNAFLTAYSMAFGASEVYPIGTRDIGKSMIRGMYLPSGEWGNTGPFLMHMEHWIKPAAMRSTRELTTRIEPALQTVKYDHPFVPSKLWFDRALRSSRSGDQIGRVVSLQTAAENLFFTTWTMTMVDEGKSSTQIDHAKRGPKPFESLFKTTIPRLLGGSWDTTVRASPVGQYWHDLYKLRNRVVHAGYVPNEAEGDSAEAGYRAVRKYLGDRLWEKRRLYPRTMLAKIGDPEKYGYQSNAWLIALRKQFESEPQYTWWLPFDLAGRE